MKVIKNATAIKCLVESNNSTLQFGSYMTKKFRVVISFTLAYIYVFKRQKVFIMFSFLRKNPSIKIILKSMSTVASLYQY